MRKINGKKGFSLLWVMLTTLGLLIIATIMVSTVIKEWRMTIDMDDSSRAFAAAQSGMEWGRYCVANPSVANCGYTTGTDATIPSSGTFSLQNGASYSVRIQSDIATPGEYKVTSTGMSNRVKQVLEYNISDIATEPVTEADFGKPIKLTGNFAFQYEFWKGYTVDAGNNKIENTNPVTISFTNGLLGSDKKEISVTYDYTLRQFKFNSIYLGVANTEQTISVPATIDMKSILASQVRIEYVNNTAAKLTVRFRDSNFNLGSANTAILNLNTQDFTQSNPLSSISISPPINPNSVAYGSLETNNTSVISETLASDSPVVAYIGSAVSENIKFLDSYTLTVVASPTAAATVPAATSYVEDTNVTATYSQTPIQQSSYTFSGWSCVEKNDEVVTATVSTVNGSFTIAGNTTCTASFSTPTATTCTLSTCSAQYVSQSTIPNTMIGGNSYSVSITMKNTGTASWNNLNNPNSFYLGSQNPPNNTNWGAGRVMIPKVVNPVPGEEFVTFEFSVTAPLSTGTYHFQWKMLQENITWFGETTPNVDISVLGIGLSNDGGGGWSYRSSSKIAFSPYFISNFQVDINGLALRSGMKDDFTDLRFWDATGSTELRYYVKNINSTTPKTADIVLRTGLYDNIFMYWGNSLATSVSDPGKTYYFYDNGTNANGTDRTGAMGETSWYWDDTNNIFPGGSRSAVYGNSVAGSSKELNVNCDPNSDYYCVISHNFVSHTGASSPITNSIQVDFDMKVPTLGKLENIMVNGNVNNTTVDSRLMWVFVTQSGSIKYFNPGSQATSYNYPANAWKHLRYVGKIDTDKQTLVYDGNTLATDTNFYTAGNVTSFNKISLYVGYYAADHNNSVWFDNIVVRGYSPTTITASIPS